MKNLPKYSLSTIVLGVLLSTSAIAQTSSSLNVAKTINSLNYVEQIQSPEDLVQIPNSKWIIASGMAAKSGLYLIDSEQKTAKRWFAPKANSASHLYPDSEPQPHADEMQIHGISLRAVEGGKYHLYAVNHNGFDKKITRETIEIFEVDPYAATPTLTWLGNVRLPEGLAGNGVVSGADGAIYTTVMTHPKDSLTDMFAGKITGAVYRWTPISRQFEKIQGSERNGNNGIELSPDGKFIYIAHMQGVSKLTNTNPAQSVANAWLDYGVADNLHWHDNILITAGSQTKNCTSGLTFDCLKDFHVTHISPENLELKPIFKGKYNQEFSGVSTVLPVGKIYYLGSFYRNKLAYFNEQEAK